MHLVNIKGYKKAAFVNGTKTYEWWIFFVTRKPHQVGITGMETARLEVHDKVVQKCGYPKPGEIYKVEYGPSDSLENYTLYKKSTSSPKST